MLLVTEMLEPPSVKIAAPRVPALHLWSVIVTFSSLAVEPVGTVPVPSTYRAAPPASQALSWNRSPVMLADASSSMKSALPTDALLPTKRLASNLAFGVGLPGP